MMEAKITEDCNGCGICEDICPEVFELGEETAMVVKKPVPEDLEDCCLDASAQCPMQAIEIIR